MSQTSDAAEMRRLGRELARNVSRMASQAQQDGISREFARVTKVYADGTLDIDKGTSAYPMPVKGVRRTTGCELVAAGDTVVVDACAHVPLVVGVVGTSAAVAGRLAATYETQENASWEREVVRASAAGDGLDLLANNVDGSSESGWASFSGSTARTDGRAQWNNGSVQMYGSCESSTGASGQYFATGFAPLTKAAKDTSSYPRRIDVSCEMASYAALQADDYACVTVQYRLAGATKWLQSCTAMLGSTFGWTQCRATVTLPAGAEIAGVWAFVHVSTAGATCNVMLRNVHARIMAFGYGGGNLMAGTGGFSALTGGAWTAAAVRQTGAQSALSHWNTPSCPVPGSDVVQVQAKTSGSECGFCQDGVSLAVGDVVTMSCWAQSSVAGAKVRIQPAWSPTSGATQPSPLSGTFSLGSAWQWTRLSWTCVVQQATTHSVGYVYSIPRAVGEKLQVCGLKVEKGPSATRWEP